MPPISTYAVNGGALREWRTRRGLTLRQLGARTGRHPQGIRKLETEDGKRVGRVFAWQIARALRVHPSAFTDAPAGAAEPEVVERADPEPAGTREDAECARCEKRWSPSHACKPARAAA